jgi:hypothetical protein
MMRDIIAKIIDKSQENIIDEPRDYIGASSIGSDCIRKIWYEFKGEKGENIPAKVRRTFDIGRKLESLVIEWLGKAGLEVITDTLTYHPKDMEYFQGHFDGIIVIDKKPHILEIKTAKDASFKIFVAKGLKLWNPQYFAQIQSYMGMSGLFSACILVLNKDNSAIYDEFITFDEGFYNVLKNKAALIAASPLPPPRISASPVWFACKVCKFNKVCHG